jgi:hypothetical protein
MSKVQAQGHQWRTIGEVCVDSGHLVICDPCRAEEASSRWTDADLDLNECAKNGIRAWELTNEHNCPIAVTVQTGLGDGCYEVQARYETDPVFGKRCAEIRIKFLPHPEFSDEAA